MSENTGIAWCDDTVNPVWGCSKISAGCSNCYASDQARRFGKDVWGDRPREFKPNALKLALRLNKRPWVCGACGHAVSFAHLSNADPEGFRCLPCKIKDRDIYLHRRRIFWESMGDWLDPNWEIEWLAAMLDTIRQCSDCTHILCTKRPEQFGKRMEAIGQRCWWNKNVWPQNVIVLASVENQETADLRIPELLRIPAAVHGLSLEPLLGLVDLAYTCFDGAESFGQMPGINWLVIGGESGHHHRPMELSWLESLAHQATTAGVPLFVKQDSRPKPGQQGRIPDALWNRKEFPDLTQ